MDTTIDFIPTSVAIDSLGVSERTLRRYVKTLKKKLRSDFDYKPREKGYTFQTFQVLVKFCELRSTGMSPERAAEFIRVHGV